eukprot:CAMPEP_0173405018 /NCGR_PEP_ID=MMETSP1356-20130122/60826_1 /TAXON_ID=77927 ORGANISM="Hemiselmis virescens, Strain PCC157" /NCGR_SAMPLE_ID=MMETSP1356 /ASSEMBLY_ACC=CAM_ASM_000847 /LENGTH=393 /DNA_ID=CAMNT_0014365775 /DNA_START=162 /DNA_END=1343 /DNA_ORIENTATION=+
MPVGRATGAECGASSPPDGFQSTRHRVAPHVCTAMPAFSPRQRPGVGGALGADRLAGAGYRTGIRMSSRAAAGPEVKFVPSFYVVTADHDPAKNKKPSPSSPADIDPTRKTCYVLHGVFGGGKNWIPFVRTHLASRLPEWQFVLVDLRGHGDSIVADGANTLFQCAADIRRLAEILGKPPDAIMGHSLGGKIAIEYLRYVAKEGQGAAPMVYVLDSWAERLDLTAYANDDAFANKGTSFMKDLLPGASFMVLRHLEAIQLPVESRTDVSKRLEEQGHCRQTTTWMCSNLRRAGAGKGLEWTFDLGVMRDLIRDAADVDSLVVMRDAVSRVVFVRAGLGMRWNPDALRRLEEGVRDNPFVSSEVIPNAAHWVHVDSPEELAGIIVPEFERVQRQ